MENGSDRAAAAEEGRLTPPPAWRGIAAGRVGGALVLLAVLVAVAALAVAIVSPRLARTQEACAPEAGADGGLAWACLPAVPRPRSELGAAAVDGVIYVVGGFGDAVFEPGGVGGEAVDAYDTRRESWRAVADLPAGVHHPGVAALGGLVYVAGGFGNDDGATAAVWAYDPATDTWGRRADLPTSRGALGLVALDGRLYAVGGARERNGGPVSDAVEVYDPAADAWRPLASLPTPREHMAVVAGAGRVWAIGGRANGDEGEAFAAAAEAYDPGADRWQALPPLPTPRGGFGGAFVAGRVVVLGGERGPTAFDAVDAYNPAAGTWAALPPLPTPRHGVAVAVVDETLYALAGSTQAQVAVNTGVVEALDLGR